MHATHFAPPPPTRHRPRPACFSFAGFARSASAAPATIGSTSIEGVSAGSGSAATASIASAPVASRRRSHGGFSLTELLVVIGIIVLLVGLLLTALSVVRKKSDRTRTEAVMQQFANACVAFQAEHGSYPGVLPEDVLAGNPLISSTENALLHLMGGYRVLSPQDTGTPYETEFNAWGDPPFTAEISYPYAGSAWKLRVDLNKIGEGPVIDGKAYPPYFTPDGNSLAQTGGQLVEPHPTLAPNPSPDFEFLIPDLVDAWGQPILYLRQQRTRGALVSAYNVNPQPQFLYETLNPYIKSSGLGEMGRSQVTFSILNTAPDDFATLARFLVHPTLDNTARGAFCLVSAGPDGVYFSRENGAGSQSAPIDNIVDNPTNPDLNNIRIVDEYDDVRIFGGG